MYIICIEINKHRMIIYKNIGGDNIRTKRKERWNSGKCNLEKNNKKWG
jgi:hypothetical protein